VAEAEPEPAAAEGAAHEAVDGAADGAAARQGSGKRALRPWLWIAAGAAAYSAHLLFGRDSAFVERFYSRGLFVALRWIWDYTLGLSPVPLLFVFWAAAVIWIAARILTRPRGGVRSSWPKKIGRGVRTVLSLCGALVFFFYVMWGFNYDRLRIETRLGLETPRLTAAELADEAAWASRSAAESRAAIPDAASAIPEASAATAALISRQLPSNLESSLRHALTGVLREMGYPAPGRVRVRSFFPGGWMMRFSSSGIYIPYFAEGYAAGTILPCEKPFTMAHEMAHGYGLTDEGDANFLAFLACAASDDPAIRYSGFLSYWGYVSSDLSRAAPAEFRSLWSGLPEGMKADIQAVRENWSRYRGALTRISGRVYERYLRSQGVREGMLSYSRFINLVAAWNKMKGRPK
jgi:hypothetical protein